MLIKILREAKKLEFSDDLKEAAEVILKDYDPVKQYHFANALYLAVNFELDTVFKSDICPPLPEFRKDLDFEQMPLEELADYMQKNRGDKVAFRIYERRWQENQDMELKESERLQKMNENGLC